LKCSSEDLSLTKETVHRYLSDNYSFNNNRSTVETNEGMDEKQWASFADLGLFALLLPEKRGGLGMAPTVMAAVMEEFGIALVKEPFAALSLPVAGVFLAGISSLPDTFNEGLLNGSIRVALAHIDHQDSRCTAHKFGSKLVCKGTKQLVLGAPLASHTMVTAHLESGGSVLGLLDLSSPGIRIVPLKTLDGSCAATVHFDEAEFLDSELVLTGQAAEETLTDCLDLLSVAACAEATGCMQALLDRTIEYTRSRKQFGRTLSSFQVLQHRMVDMKMSLELSRSLTSRAARALDQRHPLRSATVSAARVFLARESRKLGQDAIHLHGAIGITDELDVSHYVKRLLMLTYAYVEPGDHLERYHRLVHLSEE
jgi:alkylation response protein AidB-like acyl-CoA dehydrogenase